MKPNLVLVAGAAPSQDAPIALRPVPTTLLPDVIDDPDEGWEIWDRTVLLRDLVVGARAQRGYTS